MTTAPWAVEAAQLLGRSARHLVRLTAHTGAGDLVLTPTSGTLTEDEDHAPRWQGMIGCQVPADQATIDLLDPRRGVRVTIEAGYVLPSGREDAHPLATLDLYSCVIRRPQQDMILTLAGREQRIIDRDQIGAGPSWTSSTDAVTALRYLIATHDDGAFLQGDWLGPFVTGQDATVLRDGESPWGMVQTILDRVGADLWHDGLTGWRVARTSETATVTRAHLSTGSAGSITVSESERTRDGFANSVTVIHEYMTDDGPQRVVGRASVLDGPHGVTAAGRRSIVITRPYRGTHADSEIAAATLVRRAVSRGRRLSIETAHAPYWVRAGDTIQVQLPTGPPERHIVTRLDLDLPSGAWHATTRRPETITISEGE